MASLPGIIGLVIFIYIRPQEFFEPLKDFNFLYIFLVLSLAGMASDISRRRTMLMKTPHLRYVAMFTFWSIITLAIRKPAEVSTRSVPIIVCCILYLVIGTRVQSLKSFQRLVAVLDPDVVLRGDLGAQIVELRGAEQVARGAQTFSQKGVLRRPALVNGEPGLICMLDDKLIAVMAFTVHNRKIAEINILRDPERLRQLDLTALDG